MQNQAGDEVSQARDHEEWQESCVRYVPNLLNQNVQNREVSGVPYKIIRIKNTNSYRVINTETHEVKAKRTTRKRAEAQVRLLEGLEQR